MDARTPASGLLSNWQRVAARLPWLHVVGAKVGAARRGGAFHLLASLIFLQGGSYIAQFCAGFLVSPQEFGTVRRMEESLRVVTMLASLGLPSVALRAVAGNADEAARRAIMGRLLKLAAGAAVTVCLLAAVSSRFYLGGEAAPYFSALVWVVTITGLGRLGMSYLQGDKQFERMAAVSVRASLCGLVILAALTAAFGLRGWVAGRYGAEALLTASIFAGLGGRFTLRGRTSQGLSYRGLLAMGGVESLSLTVGVAYNSAGLLALGYWGGSQEEVGYYGLGTLLNVGALLLTSAIAMSALPRLIETLKRPDEGWLFFRRTLRHALFVSLCATAALGLVLPLVAGILHHRYRHGLPVLYVLLLCVPLQVIILFSRDWLFASHRSGLAAVLTLCALAASMLFFRLVVPVYGAYGTAWVQVGLTAALAAVYWPLNLWVRRGHAKNV